MGNFRQYLSIELDSKFSELGIDNRDSTIKVHKELLKGKPITKEKCLSILNLSNAKSGNILEKAAEFDSEGNIVAFLGLSLIPTKHKLIIENKTFYTWCVIDAILFTEWLDVTSVVHSNDPIDNTPIELKIKGNQMISSNPYPLFVSWVESMNTCDIRNSLCNHVSFFASNTTSNQWLKESPNGKVITIDDFFEVGQIEMK